MRHPRLIALGGTLVAGSAAWLCRASLGVYALGAGGAAFPAPPARAVAFAPPARVAMFASLARLGADLAIALAAGACLFWLLRLRARSTGRPLTVSQTPSADAAPVLLDRTAPRSPSADEACAEVFVPLYGLGVLSLSWLLWLPDRVPAVLALAGPLRWLIVAIIAALVLWHFVDWWMRSSARPNGRQSSVRSPQSCNGPNRPQSPALSPQSCSGPPRVREERPLPRALALQGILVLASIAWYGVAVGQLVGHILPGGDEPHYLIITQSLLLDHDLAIENNHRRGDYLAYYPQALRPDYLRRGKDGKIYSVHAPGLPAIVTPAFALAGYHGVLAFLIAVAAGAGLLLWRSAYVLTGSKSAATAAWAATCLTSPYLFQAVSVYPEIVAAALVMTTFALLVRWPAYESPPPRLSPRSSVLTWSARGLPVAILPWLNTKFAPLACALALIVVLRIVTPGAFRSRELSPNNSRRRRWLLAVWFGLPLLVSLLCWFGFFYALYGDARPSAAYGGVGRMGWSHLSVGGLGLLFDQEYGVLPYAPVYVLVAAGLWRMWRAGGAAARLAIEIVVTVAVLDVTVASFDIWWGGSSAPARPLVAAILPLALPVAWSWRDAADRRRRRAAQRLLLAATLVAAATLIFARNGALIANDRDGSATFLEWLSPEYDLPPLLPSFFGTQPLVAIAHSLAWLAGAALVGWLLRLGENRSTQIAAADARTSRPTAGSTRAPRTGESLAALCLTCVVTIALASAGSLVASARRRPPLGPSDRARIAFLDDFDPAARPMAVRYAPLRRTDPLALPALFSFHVDSEPVASAGPPPLLLFGARFGLPAGTYSLLVEKRRTTALEGEIRLRIAPRGAPLTTWRPAEPGGGLSARPWQADFDLPVDSNYVGLEADGAAAGSIASFTIRPRLILPVSARPRVPLVESAARYGREGETLVLFHDLRHYPAADGFWVWGERSTEVSFVPARASRHRPIAREPGTPAAAGLHLLVRNGPVRNRVTLQAAGWHTSLALGPREARVVDVPANPRAPGIFTLEIGSASGFKPAETEPGSPDRRVLGCWIGVP